MATKSMAEVNSELAKKFIEFLENGLVDGEWTKPWIFASGFPQRFNEKEKKWDSYSGVNAFFLMIEEMYKEYNSHYWLTYKQWVAKGRRVNKGEKGTYIYRPNFFKDKDDPEIVRIRGFSAYAVFNFDQTSLEDEENGFVPEPPKASDKTVSDKAGDKFLSKIRESAPWKIIDQVGDRAYYVPAQHTVYVPPIEQFTDARYYGTVFHECAHATGHKSLMDRKFGTSMAEKNYALEELVAELTAAFVGANVGIESFPENDHLKYIGHWINAIKGNPGILNETFKIANRAAEGLFAIAEGKGDAFEWKIPEKKKKAEV